MHGSEATTILLSLLLLSEKSTTNWDPLKASDKPFYIGINTFQEMFGTQCPRMVALGSWVVFAWIESSPA